MSRMVENEELAKKGRKGDTHLAHVAEGEIIVPPVISDDLKAQIHAEMREAGIDPYGHTVGAGMSINPHTGQPEFGIGKFFKKTFKSVKKVVKKVAPIAQAVLPFVPGIGIPLSAALGAGLGAINGGGLKGALLGGAGGFVGAGGLGSVAGSALGGGLQGATQGSGLLGALTRGGGALSSGIRSVASGISGLKSSLLGGLGKVGIGSGGAYDPSKTFTQTGMKGGVPIGTYSASSSLARDLMGGVGGQGGTQGSFNTGNLLKNLYGGIQGDKALRQAQNAQLQAINSGIRGISPWQQSGLKAQNKYETGLGLNGEDPEEIMEMLSQNPDYKFRMQQGNQAIDRSLGARGQVFSGRAIKEGQAFGQGMASDAYSNYMDRLAGQSRQGLNASLVGAEMQQDRGNIRANTIAERNRVQNQSLANVLTPRAALDEMLKKQMGYA